MKREDHYCLIRNKIASIFSELLLIVEAIKDDFEKENRQHPRLTMKVVNYHLDIVRRHQSHYHGSSDKDLPIDKLIQSTSRSISSFYREFDNPFRGSQRWYQRIVQLLDQLSQESRELDRLLEMEEE